MNTRALSNKSLKSQYLELDDLINNTGCYGVRDLILFEALEKEINKRGIEIAEHVYFVE